MRCQPDKSTQQWKLSDEQNMQGGDQITYLLKLLVQLCNLLDESVEFGSENRVLFTKTDVDELRMYLRLQKLRTL